MKSILVTIIIWTALTLYVAEIKVSFKPFKVSFDSPLLAVSMLCIFIGLTCYGVNSYQKGRLKGYNEGCDDMAQAILDKAKGNSIESKRADYGK